MTLLYEILRWAQAAVFAAVAVVAIRRWFTRRGLSRVLIAAMFTLLAAVSLASDVLPARSDDPAVELARKIIIASITLFPYLLFRFAATFKRWPAWLEVVAAALTLAAGGGIFMFDSIPATGEPRPASFQLYIDGLLVQWMFLSALVIGRLWTSGRNLPNIARRRMQTLSLGTLAIVLALFVAAAARPSEEPGVINVVSTSLAILSAPLFLLGFAPPQIAIAIWRRKDEARLRRAEEGLMRAQSREEIADIVLEPAAALFGASGASLIDENNEVIGVFGEPGSSKANSVPMSIAVGSAALKIEASPYAPYFGREEQELLGILGTLTTLALIRTEQAEQLRAANEAMRDFVAIASHDLRTPITVVKGMGLALKDRWRTIPPDTVDKHIDAILRQSGVLGRLVDDLLMVSKIESGAVEARPAPVDVKGAVATMLQDLNEDGFEVRIPDGVTAIVDPDHFIRILANYIRNAKLYGEPPFVIEASREEDAVKISVEDHGAGVPDDFETRLFEKFARADKQESMSKEGTGLGLSIVKGLAAASGGDVGYEKLKPRGSRFWARLKAG